ncbi:MAG: hypothetical protein RDU20_23205 [Desulfomonilaceae bacterium]|nr:hypothetical protein [Desulfomonilaceae bacterium]
MQRALTTLPIVLILGLIAGCSYLQTKDVPPPLPPIEEIKPPLKLRSTHFKAFPWDELPEPQKDGNDIDTTTYILKDGDTLRLVAEKRMGDAEMADKLAAYNELTSPEDAKPGDKIVIPNPILGVSSQIMVKSKGDKEFGSPKPFGVGFEKGDQYKLRFETNIKGYCYILRQGVKQVVFLFPPKAEEPKPRRGAKPQPVKRESAEVRAFEPISIPPGDIGFQYDAKKAGDRIYVFLSLREIPSLEDLKDKKTIPREELEDVMRRVKLAEILDDPPYHLLRISDPSEILGFTLNIDG